MSEPKDHSKEVPCWRYKRDTRQGRKGMLISHLCETWEEKEHYEKIGYLDHFPPMPKDSQQPLPAAEPEPRQIGIDLDGDGTIDVEIKEKPKKKPKPKARRKAKKK